MLRYGTIQLEGRTVGYATEGSGPPLLLLHSPPFDHRQWAPTIPYLSGRMRVVALDLPGFGRSDSADAEGSPDYLLRVAAGFVTATGMVPCAVAGAGLGGGLALSLAARYPERVRAVIGVGALGVDPWPATAQARRARATRGVPGLLPLVLRLGPTAQARAFLKRAFADERHVEEALIEQIAAMLRQPSGRRTIGRVLGHLDEWRQLARQLGAVRAPTLLVWGERDEVYPLPTAERLRHTIPGARLVSLAGAGHALTIERPVELAETIRAFLLG